MLNDYQEYILHRDLECLQIRHQLLGFQALLEHSDQCLQTLEARYAHGTAKLDWYSGRVDLCSDCLSGLPYSALQPHEKWPIPVRTYKRRVSWLQDKRKENRRRIKKLSPLVMEDRDAIKKLTKQKHQVVASIRKLKARLDKLKALPGSLTQYNNEQRKNYNQRRWYLVTPLRPVRGYARIPDPIDERGGSGSLHQGGETGQPGEPS